MQIIRKCPKMKKNDLQTHKILDLNFFLQLLAYFSNFWENSKKPNWRMIFFHARRKIKKRKILSQIQAHGIWERENVLFGKWEWKLALKKETKEPAIKRWSERHEREILFLCNEVRYNDKFSFYELNVLYVCTVNDYF